MLGRQPSWSLGFVFVALLVVAGGAQAQVDWSDLFPEDGGKPAAKALREPQHAEPVPAPVRRGRIAKPQTAPAPVQRVAVSKPRRKANPPQQHYDRDREFPAVPEVRMPQFDRQSSAFVAPAAAVPDGGCDRVFAVTHLIESGH